MQIRKKILLAFVLILSFLFVSCGHNKMFKQDNETWFVKFQTGILSGECFHTYNNKIRTKSNSLTFQNRSMLPVTIYLSDHSVTTSVVFTKYLEPGQVFSYYDVENNAEYFLNLKIEDNEGSKNGIIAVYGQDEIIPFDYIEVQEEQHNILLDIYNKMFSNLRY